MLNIRAGATTFITSQDGNWEDSASWNGRTVSDTVANDTFIIRHHLNFNGNLMMSSCYLQLDSGGSICGKYIIHWFMSSVFQDGGSIYALYFLQESSVWIGTSGFFQFLDTCTIWGQGSYSHFCCGQHGFVGGDFECAVPLPISYPDSSQNDSTYSAPPIDTMSHFVPALDTVNINVYPNPSLNDFIIETYLSKNHTNIMIDVYDLPGSRLMQIPVPAGRSVLTVLNSDWPAGVYLLRMTENEMTLQMQKIIHLK